MDLNISGAKVFIGTAEHPILTETVVVTWIVMAVIVAVARYLTKDMDVHATKKRQVIAEYLVTSVRNMVGTNMGEKCAESWYVPFIGAMFALSAGCSLSSMFGAYAPTSDLSTVLAWAVFVFILITYTKLKTNGLGGYIKGFAEPIVVMFPMNVISEIATPISMAFRHFGNIASGSVITALIYGGLAALSSMVLGLIPGSVGNVLSQIPILSAGIPAILSIYFDLFSSVLQAFIFSMLTMMYIGGAAGN